MEKWKFCNDKCKSFVALFTDLSKAFDCLSHDLLIAKIHAYGFECISPKLVYSYVKERKQRTKIGTSISFRSDLLFEVPQGSNLGPILFNIFLCGLFLLMKDVDIASYADDNTPYIAGDYR